MMLKIISAALILVLGAAGCAQDKSPVLPVDIHTISVDKRPQGFARSLDAGNLLVSCYGSRTVCEINLEDRCVSQRLEVRKGPNRLIPDINRRGIYCLHTGENVLAILGGNPVRVRRIMGTGSIALAGGALRPNQGELWICDGVSSVYILLAGNMKLKDKIQLGRYTQQVAFDRGGSRAFVTMKGENAIAVVNATKKEEIARIPVGIYPRDIVLVGNTACISNYGSHDISLVDTAKLEERARIRVRRKPNSLSARGNTLWVSCEDSYRIVAIDVAKAKIIGTIKTGFYPGAIMALADGSLAVANPRRNKVALIQPRKLPAAEK